MDGEVTAVGSLVFDRLRMLFFGWTLDPSLSPGLGEPFEQIGAEVIDRGGPAAQGGNELVNRNQDVERDQFPIEVVEELESGKGGRGTVLCFGDEAAHDVEQVVQQHAQGGLKDNRVGTAADETAEMKDFGNLLEHLLDAPAAPVKFEKIVGRITVGVEQVRDQAKRWLAGAVQRDATDDHGSLTTAVQLADFIGPGSAFRIDASAGG